MDDPGVLRGMGWFTAERGRVYAVAAAVIGGTSLFGGRGRLGDHG